MKKGLHQLVFSVLFGCFVALPIFSIAQSNKVLNWLSPVTEIKSDLSSVSKLYFEGSYFPHEDSLIPLVLINKHYSQSLSYASIEISNVVYKNLSTNEIALLGSSTNAPSVFRLNTKIKKHRKKHLVQLTGNSIVNRQGKLQKVVSFDYKINPEYRQLRTAKTSSSVDSQLSSGTWYKLAVTETGVYRLDATFLATIGVNINNINPKNIKILGNGTGMLPESNLAYVPETLQEISIAVGGENDNSFDNTDYILFYGVGPHTWNYNSVEKIYEHNYHLYSDTAYYFISFDSNQGKRIESVSQPSAASTASTSLYDDYAFHEINKSNALKSGKKWLGEYFDNTKNYNFNFSFPNIATGYPVKVKSTFGVRSFVTSGSDLTMSVNGNTIASKKDVFAVSSYYTARYAREVSILDSTLVNSSSLSVGVSYNKPEASSVAWLDYIVVNSKNNLNFSTGQLSFRSMENIGSGKITTFNLSSSKDIDVWDVTDPINVKYTNHTFSNSSISFKASTDSLKEFLAFDGSKYLSPISMGTVPNQNILKNINKDYILICPSTFKSASQELVDFHNKHSGITAELVTTEEVYNEFSSGAQDVTAIRDYMRYLYKNSSNPPKYLMLMGDASYDYKDVIPNNTNFVPAFQSKESFNPLSSFTSDDFYGILDDSGEIYSDNATVDIGIGRFPAKSPIEVASFIEKVKNYVNSQGQDNSNQCSTADYTKSTFGNWRNSMLFVADDGNTEDNYSRSHLTQTELIVSSIEAIDSVFNIKKVYLDAYKKVSGPGGGTYPEVKREINNKVTTGTSVMSYIGHGGEAGWADERVLEVEDINSWSNIEKLPLFLTATCEFSRFDNPERVSAGEHVILNPSGGAIAMLTTVRLVFGGISNNIGFSINFFKHNITPVGTTYNTFGDAVRLTKVESPIGSSHNNRKFALIGDPAVRLSVPQYKVKTIDIQNKNGEKIDTLKALSKIKVSGEVLTPNGSASNFNGLIFPTVYDVYKKSYTLNNNNTNLVDTFNVQNNILFKGKATVTGGKFSFEFIVPKDISYSFGAGKLSYYIANESEDGAGYSDDFKVGGTASNYSEDSNSPEVEIFFNDSNFIDGGLTNESPVLIVNLSDESGINTSGNGVGHDITAVLDNDYANPIVLNEYYEANVDDYTGGSVRYNLSDLSEGSHTLTIKAWDVHNNSASSSINFIVSNSSNLALEHVLNYPNPFSSNTKFYFEHNHACNSIDVQVKIFTISGKLVKTLTKTVSGSGNLKNNFVAWDGKDDYGDMLGKGVYLYQLEAITSDGLKDKKMEKLVILN